MKGASKHKGVSSGRLTGGGRGQPARRRVIGGQAPKTLQRPTGPAYSLYSTDSEDQVATIHKGLDRCAILLNGILQAEKAEATPSLVRAVKSGAAKQRPRSSLGKERDTERKRATKKSLTKTANLQRGPPSPTLRAKVQSPAVDADPGFVANCCADPVNPTSGAKTPQSAPSRHGPDICFNPRLTTSTPTLSPEKPVSSATGHPTNAGTPGYQAQRQASSAGADGPDGPKVHDGASEALSLAPGVPVPPQIQAAPLLPCQPSSHPLPSPSPACSLPHSGSSASGARAPAPQGVCGPGSQHLGLGRVPGSQHTAIPSAPCSCSVHLCELHAPPTRLPAQSRATSKPQAQSQSETLSQSQVHSHPVSQRTFGAVPLAQPRASVPLRLHQSHPLLPQPQTHASPLSLSLPQPGSGQNHRRPPLPTPLSQAQCLHLPQPSLPVTRDENLPFPQSRSQPALHESRTDYKPPRADSGTPSTGTRGSEPSSGEGRGHGGATCVEEEEKEVEEECFPVRDISSQTNSGKQMHTAASIGADGHTSVTVAVMPARSNLPPERGHTDAPHAQTPLTHTAPSVGREDCPAEKMEVKVTMIQRLLGELKALVAEQGGVAERLLCDLEQTVALLPAMAGSSNIQAEIALALQPLRNENTQLRRRVRILNQQLQERERAERGSRERHCDSEVSTLQAELGDAQSQLGVLQDDITELQQALRDTRSQLQQREAETTHLRTDLEAASSRLLEKQRQKTELALLAQQRLEEIHSLHNLNRILQDRVSSDCPAVIDSSVSRPPLTKRVLDQHQSRQDTAEPAPDPVSQYLSSLSQRGRVLGSPPCKGPAAHSDRHIELGAIDSRSEIAGESFHAPGENECLSVSVERGVCVTEEGSNGRNKLTAQMSAQPAASSQQGGGPPVPSAANYQSLDNVFKLLHQSKSVITPHLDQSDGLPSKQTQSFRRRLEMGQDSSLDSVCQSEVGSVASDWSVGSGSGLTFDTRDEMEFRNGLAALDASIASLQRTIKMDMVR
ncbi:uncharacterized protein ccdc14 [Polymixia lowei]